MNTLMPLDLLKEVHTTDQASQLLSDIDIFIEMLSTAKTEALQTELLKRQVRANIAGMFLAVRTQFYGDSVKIREFFKEVKRQVTLRKRLRLTLAYAPSEGSIEAISSFVQGLLGEEVLLELGQDAGILGGALIEFGGFYKDCSLKKRIDDVFARKREEFTLNV